jgi:hypothetical protein
MKEKRKIKRFDLQLSAQIEIVDHNPKGEILYALTRDISSNGAYFYTMKPFSVGKRVKIDLVLKQRRLDISGTPTHVKVNGTVLRSDPMGMAIGFDKDYMINERRVSEISV